METTNRYSDKELLEFKKIILEKISKAQNDLELLKSAYMNDGNNGTAVSYTHLTLPTTD